MSQRPVFDMLCESCHQREANHHITTCINGDAMQKRDLCPECFLASSPDLPPESRRLATAQRDARCVYCGSKPYIGGTVLLAGSLGLGPSRSRSGPSARSTGSFESRARLVYRRLRLPGLATCQRNPLRDRTHLFTSTPIVVGASTSRTIAGDMESPRGDGNRAA